MQMHTQNFSTKGTPSLALPVPFTLTGSKYFLEDSSPYQTRKQGTSRLSDDSKKPRNPETELSVQVSRWPQGGPAFCMGRQHRSLAILGSFFIFS